MAGGEGLAPLYFVSRLRGNPDLLSIGIYKYFSKSGFGYKVYLKSEKENLNRSKIVTLTKEQNVILKLLDCSV